MSTYLRVISYSPLSFAVSKTEIHKLINAELQSQEPISVDQSGFKATVSEWRSDFIGWDKMRIQGKLRGKYKKGSKGFRPCLN